MLRCAGCGGPVSEWAARCPACRRPADDAVPVPERRLRGRPRRAVLAVAAVLTAVAATAVLGTLATARGTATGGRLLAFGSDGSLLLVGAAGHPAAAVRAPAGPGLVVAADGQSFAAGTGQVLALRGDRLVPTGRSAPLDGPPGSWRAADFADHDQALVATESGGAEDPAGGQPAEVVPLAGGRPLPLGPALAVAGDPAAVGAVVVEADPAEVVLADAGRRPVVLATVDQLERALRLPAGGPAVVEPAPGPGGAEIALTVVPLLPSEPTGVVVVRRTGGIVAVIGRGTVGAAWSPRGGEVATVDDRTVPPSVVVWTGRGGDRRLPAPRAVGALGLCVWAPSGRAVACGVAGPASAAGWVLATTGATGGSRWVRRPDLPVAWISG